MEERLRFVARLLDGEKMAPQNAGVKQVDDGIWVVSFMHYDLGYFDLQSCKINPVTNPFSAKVLPMCPE